MTSSASAFSTEELVKLAAAAALEKKASRPVILNLRNQGTFTDYFLIVSAANPRQALAVADAIRMFFKETFDLMPVSMDGLDVGTWVLLDYGSFFVHVFQEPTRELYQLEQLWSKAVMVPVQEGAVTEFYNTVKQAHPRLRQDDSVSAEA